MTVIATRRERVVLILNDQFTGPITKAAGATALLNRELNSLNRGHRTLSTSAVQSSRSIDRTTRSTTNMGVAMVRADRQIDRLSGRLKIIIQAATALGPALSPIATSLVPVLTGLSTGLGFTAAAAGTAVIALKGVGEALEAVEVARLEPTVANLEAAAMAVERLGPDGAKFVQILNDARPALQALQMDARAGLLPGLGDSFETILTRGDQVGRILFEIGDATGDLFRNASSALASGDFDRFFTFIETEARPQLTKLGTTLGLVAKAGTDVFMALDPLTDDFGSGLLRGAENLAAAAARMEDSQGVQDFISYVRETGPQVVDTFLAIGNAVIQIGTAAAPLGGPVLAAVEGFANAVATIADSPIGTPLVTLAVGAAALARAVAVVTALELAVGKVGKASGAAGLASRALVNPFVAVGVAAGGAIVYMDKLGRASSGYEVNANSLIDTLNAQTGAITQNTRDFVAKDLAQQGVFESAKALGIGLDVVTSAALGNDSALAQMNAQVEAASAGFYDTEGRTIVGAEVLGDYRQNVLTVTDAVGQNNSALSEGASAARDHAEAMGSTTSATSAAEEATRAMVDALREADELLNKRATFRNYEEALDNAAASLKENGKNLNINTEKGRANQSALDGIADSALRLAENLGPLNKVRVLTQARRDFISTATDMGMPRKAARELANELFALDKVKANPKITAETDAAQNKLDAFRRQMDALSGRTATTYVDTVYRQRGTDNRAPVARASGGPIYGPGTGTSDSIPARLSNGEYVINAKATSLNRRLLEAINTSGRTKRFANGGAVDGRVMGSVNANPAAGSLDRLARSGDRAAKSLDKATTRRDNLLSRRNDIRSSVAGAFRTDQWATGDNVWSEGASADPLASLKRDTANARAFQAAVATLKRNGLDGKALEDLVSRGDLGIAQQLAGQSRSYISQYESAYNTRERVTAGAGAAAANAVVGDELKRANSRLDRLNDQVKKLRDESKDNAKRTGDAVGEKVNQAASRGSRDKNRNR